MSKMGQALENGIDNAKYDLYQACVKVLELSGQLHTCQGSDPTGSCLGCTLEHIVNNPIVKAEGWLKESK